MSQPNPVNILSDDESETLEIPAGDDSTPVTFNSKRQRTLFDSKTTATVFVIDDDPTPRKSSGSTPSIVPETPMSDLQNSGPLVVRCSKPISDPKPSGIIIKLYSAFCFFKLSIIIFVCLISVKFEYYANELLSSFVS